MYYFPNDRKYALFNSYLQVQSRKNRPFSYASTNNVFKNVFTKMVLNVVTYPEEQITSLRICTMLRLSITVFHISFVKSNLKTVKATSYNESLEMLYYGYIHFNHFIVHDTMRGVDYMDNDIVIFKNGELELEVSVSEDRNTVWLSLDQMAELFSRDKSTISRHIRNMFNEGELDKNSVVAKFATTASDGKTYQVDYFNLDVIISVGYRVKSKRGVQFRIWATSILKNYMLKGYAINQKRLEALDRTVKIQSRIIASTLELDEKEVLNVVEAYADALTMLDDYDHGCLVKPNGKDTIYRLSYEECRNLIDSMRFESDVFGIEREPGKLEGILAAVYQNVFGTEVYPSIEEKAANLLYFLIKDHPFADGCKRIGASIFLEFLNKNNHLIIDHRQIISSSALVAMTLMIAESRPEEKEIMVKLVMNFLK